MISEEKRELKNTMDYKSKYIQAFVINFTFFRTFEEYRTAVLTRQKNNLEALLSSTSADWTVPRWSHKDDIALFMYSASAIKYINAIQKALLQEATQPRRTHFKPQRKLPLLDHDKELFKKYGGCIVGFGRLTDDPILSDYGGRKHASAPISDICILDEPLPASEFTSFLRISQGGETPVWGEWYTKIKNMIIESNDNLPEYFLDADSMTAEQSKINETTWLKENLKVNFNYRREEEFRTFYIDYLLRELSDDHAFLTECACYKSELKSPSFADYIIRINDKLLPVEAKVDINIEADINHQVSKYCDVTKVVLDPHTGNCADLEKLDQQHVLIIDERQIQMYDHNTGKREILTKLETITTKNDINILRKQIITLLMA